MKLKMIETDIDIKTGEVHDKDVLIEDCFDGQIEALEFILKKYDNILRQNIGFYSYTINLSVEDITGTYYSVDIKKGDFDLKISGKIYKSDYAHSRSVEEIKASDTEVYFNKPILILEAIIRAFDKELIIAFGNKYSVTINAPFLTSSTFDYEYTLTNVTGSKSTISNVVYRNKLSFDNE